MQFVVASETNVSGPDEQRVVLPQPETRHDFYRDIAVLAFPDLNHHAQPTITCDFTTDNPEVLLDNDRASAVALPVKVIAERCGFPKLRTFYAAFRRETGISPGTLRNRRAFPDMGKTVL